MAPKTEVLHRWGKLIAMKNENRDALTPSSKKWKAGEEVEEERPEKRHCLNSGDHEKRKHRPNFEAKSPSPKVRAVESQSSRSKESFSNSPNPFHDEDRLFFTSSNQCESSSTWSSESPSYSIPTITSRSETITSSSETETTTSSSETMIPKEEFKAKYEEREVLGEGGFGAVYAGLQRSDLKQVAIKHIPKEKVTHMLVYCQNSFHKWVSEVVFMAQAAGRLYNDSEENHSVIGLLDVYDLEEEVMIVMECPQKYLNIFDFINQRDGEILEHDAKSIMKQLVDADLLMHKNGIFHRDIKGKNVLVSTEEKSLPISIIEFGCGDFIQDQSYRKFRGPVKYAPPEVFELTGYKAEPTTVWQIGLMLNSMFNYKYNTIIDHSFLSQECFDFMNLTFDPEQQPGLDKIRRHPWLQ